MDQNNYDFIFKAEEPPKQQINPKDYLKKKFIIPIVAVIFIVIAVIIFTGGSEDPNKRFVAPVTAVQSDIIELTEIGLRDGRQNATLNESATNKLVLTTHFNETNSYLGKGANQLYGPLKNTQFKAELERSISNGSFDEDYAVILQNKLDLYEQQIVTAYGLLLDNEMKQILARQLDELKVLDPPES